MILMGVYFLFELLYWEGTPLLNQKIGAESQMHLLSVNVVIGRNQIVIFILSSYLELLPPLVCPGDYQILLFPEF